MTIAYSGGLTYALARILEKTIGLRAARDDELAGIDEAEHAETGYDHGRIGIAAAAIHPSRAAHHAPAAAGARPGTTRGPASLKAC